MKNKKYLLIIFIIIQSIMYIIVGCNKQYLHIDEVYSFGLTNYDKVEIQDNVDFFNNWHTHDYYNDYLTIQPDETGDLKPVYENQKNDVHPPLFYLILRTSMEFAKEHFSMWTGIIPNIIMYGFITIFMYLILKELFADETKAMVLAFASSVILASLSNAVYIRMYALLTLEVTIITYLHIKLLRSEKVTLKLLAGIGICNLTGFLTHYYMIYLAPMYLIFAVKYIKEHRLKELADYTASVLISGVISLIIFPYSINHMFSGYRGNGVIESLKDIKQFIPSIKSYLEVINYYAFNQMLYVIVPVFIVLFVCVKRSKSKVQIDNGILKVIWIPTVVFGVFTIITAPWKVLRYIVPVCGFMFVLVMYVLEQLMQAVFSKKAADWLTYACVALVLTTPVVLKLEPELLYTSKKELVQSVNANPDVKAVYWIDKDNDYIINDDIYLFAKLSELYIAKDAPCTEETVSQILKGKDISNGLILLINKEDYGDILQVFENTTGFTQYEQLDTFDKRVVLKLY